MLDYEKLIEQGQACGFTHVAPLDVATIILMPEVRQMCEQNTCGKYGASWYCPPGLGPLEECEKKLRRFSHGILVQTVGELEDSMDFESMMETEAAHKEHFKQMQALLEGAYGDIMAIGAGTCTRCPTCTYPDAPCRFPNQSFGSMEGYGMLVTQVCQANNLAYYYGQNTLAYTSCFLLEKA